MTFELGINFELILSKILYSIVVLSPIFAVYYTEKYVLRINYPKE